jgi:hypothetical protein
MGIFSSHEIIKLKRPYIGLILKILFKLPANIIPDLKILVNFSQARLEADMQRQTRKQLTSMIPSTEHETRY